MPAVRQPEWASLFLLHSQDPGPRTRERSDLSAVVFHISMADHSSMGSWAASYPIRPGDFGPRRFGWSELPLPEVG